jgi:hypothetical protein
MRAGKPNGVVTEGAVDWLNKDFGKPLAAFGVEARGVNDKVTFQPILPKEQFDAKVGLLKDAVFAATTFAVAGGAGAEAASGAAATADTIPEGMRLSTSRVTQPGETFFRYESGDPNYSRVTASGGVTPGTYAAPTSDGFLPEAMRGSAYNLDNPKSVPRVDAKVLSPPGGTPIIGPRPVEGGYGNEVRFPNGYAK